MHLSKLEISHSIPLCQDLYIPSLFASGELVVSPAELRFFPGDTEKCFTVGAVADSTLEQTLEEYTLQLNASSNLVILSNTLITVTIVDQDCEYTYSALFAAHIIIEPVLTILQTCLSNQ